MNDLPETVIRSFALPSYLYEALQLLALGERRSINQQLRVILEESLEAPKEDRHV